MIEDKEMQKSVELSLKIVDLYVNMRSYVEQELMKFTYDELKLIESFYGKELVYPLYADIVDTLDGIPLGEVVH